MSEPSATQENTIESSRPVNLTLTPPVEFWNKKIRYLLGFFSISFSLSFFLPWINLFGARMSGYEVMKIPDDPALKWIWLLPVSGLLAFTVATIQKYIALVSRLAGALAFLTFAYCLTKGGPDLLRVLDVGAYLQLIFGTALFVTPYFLKKSAP